MTVVPLRSLPMGFRFRPTDEELVTHYLKCKIDGRICADVEVIPEIDVCKCEPWDLPGSARNAYHTKYWGYYAKKDLASCAALRKGVFAAAAAMVLVSLVSSLLFYWSHSKSDNGGWVKHQNEGSVGMAEYDGPDKSDFATGKA